MLRLITLLAVLTGLWAAPSHAGWFDRKVMVISVEREPWEITTLGGARVKSELITITVPENRSRRDTRPIAVRMVRVPAREPSGLPPVLVLADGSAIERARGVRWAAYRALSEVTDVILVDPRGIGQSEKPLDCVSSARWDGRITSRRNFVKLHRQAFRECQAFWQALGTDLRGYTLHESADDLAAIADIFGGKVSILGSGTGSQHALAMVKHHPKKVERIALTGVRGLGQTVAYPDEFDPYLDRLQRVIDADRGALNRFPDISESIRELTERLDKNPQTITVVSADKRAETVRVVSGYYIQRAIADAVRNPDQLRTLLEGLWQASENNDFSYFERQVQRLIPDRITVEAAPTLFALHQGADKKRLRRVREQARTSPMGDALSFPMPHIASVGRMYRGRNSVRQRPSANVPTLVFIGTLDGYAPEPAVRKATRGLRKNRVIVTVENGGHDIFFDSSEVVPTIRSFLQRDTVAGRTISTPPPVVSPRAPQSASTRRRGENT